MRKILSLAMAFILLPGLIGCTEAESEGIEESTQNSIKIGITVYDSHDVFVSELIEKFNDYAQRQSDEQDISINIDQFNASQSQSTQNSQVKDMLDKDYDCIMVNLVDRTDAGRIIEMSKDTGVPIIFFNRELVENDLEQQDNLYYVGAVTDQAGKLEGELAARYFSAHPDMDTNGDGAIQYVILEGEAGHQDAKDRTKYSVSTMEDAGISLDKVSYAIANWSRDQAKAKVFKMIEDNLHIEMILSNNDAMALGAIEAYRESNMREEDWPAIFGIDGVTDGLKAITDGTMKATVMNDSEGQAEALLDLALTLKFERPLSDLNFDTSNEKLLNKCIRTDYQCVTPCATCEEGYAVWSTEEELLAHNLNDQAEGN